MENLYLQNPVDRETHQHKCVSNMLQPAWSM